ncbi:hypothetical protein [Deinococcus sonorensis]|uniref:Uncharacterized protein n=1 Tax=Deinococcus sonorensis TaxID=309891 RepID=A0ABV8Y866_9DEIO
MIKVRVKGWYIPTVTRAGWSCPDSPMFEKILNGISGPNRVPSW